MGWGRGQKWKEEPWSDQGTGITCMAWVKLEPGHREFSTLTTSSFLKEPQFLPTFMVKTFTQRSTSSAQPFYTGSLHTTEKMPYTGGPSKLPGDLGSHQWWRPSDSIWPPGEQTGQTPSKLFYVSYDVDRVRRPTYRKSRTVGRDWDQALD